MRGWAAAVVAVMTMVLAATAMQPAAAEAPATQVTGRIVDDLDRPVKGMKVRLTPAAGGAPIDLVTSATGEVTTTAAAPGRYTLVAEEFFTDSFYWEPNPVKYTWVDPVSVTVQEGTTSLGTLEVARGGTVRATVSTPSGHRLPRYLVEAKGAASPVFGERYSFTDARGILTLRGLPTGTWPLTGRQDFSDNIPKVTFPSLVRISKPGEVVRNVKLVTKVHWSTFLRDRGYVRNGVPLAGPGEVRFGVRIGNTYRTRAEFDLWRDKPLRLSLYRDGKRIKFLYVKLGKSKIYTIKQPKGTHTYKWIWGGDADTFRIASKPLTLTSR
ncbi:MULTISPECIES: carboxypeptidase-like regulatory domain-containing protein [unclassified Aeromicrobium]|uniref:carboxypeptidase-like regulatory domain-containing protein n=1 Tax=unclassified Aeromicrobium TaxID=2633570 RepID=UPI00396AF4A9